MGGCAGTAGATVTVIFADVEGSTALLERLGQARWLTCAGRVRGDARQTASTCTGARSSRRWATATCSPSPAPTPRCAARSTSSARCRSPGRPTCACGWACTRASPWRSRTTCTGARWSRRRGSPTWRTAARCSSRGSCASWPRPTPISRRRSGSRRAARSSCAACAGATCVLAAQWQREDRGPIRVVIADDSAIVRDGVAALLRECGVHVAGLATDPESLYREIERHRPDVALVDIRMPPTGHQRGPRRRRAHRPRVPRGRRPRALPVPGARLRPAPRGGPGGAARLSDQGPRRRDRDPARRRAPRRQRRHASSTPRSSSAWSPGPPPAARSPSSPSASARCWG